MTGTMTHTFRYGSAAIDHLKKRDTALGRAIDAIGPVVREVQPDLFTALVASVASQQISAKAAETVWARMEDRFGTITPKAIARASVTEIQACGMSGRKAEYIRGIGEAVHGGTLDLDALAALPDDEVIARLTALRGVGAWTAEMLLIFSMERPDVVSFGDFAIRRGMARLYRKAEIDRAAFDRYRKRYSPYGSVASLYLWELAHRPGIP